MPPEAMDGDLERLALTNVSGPSSFQCLVRKVDRYFMDSDHNDSPEQTLDAHGFHPHPGEKPKPSNTYEQTAPLKPGRSIGSTPLVEFMS